MIPIPLFGGQQHLCKELPVYEALLCNNMKHTTGLNGVDWQTPTTGQHTLHRCTVGDRTADIICPHTSSISRDLTTSGCQKCYISPNYTFIKLGKNVVILFSQLTQVPLSCDLSLVFSLFQWFGLCFEVEGGLLSQVSCQSRQVYLIEWREIVFVMRQSHIGRSLL